uniref:Centrosomal protein POC5 n=1 Tax=Xiphophorus couchianus TaxID=32473 RepID=A0A3B5MFR9_9TELE
YEELFRYAVITPKHDLLSIGQGQSSQRTDEPSGQHLQGKISERTAGPSSSKTSVRSNAPSEDFQAASKSSDNQESHDCAFTEMFISEENLGKMENILDTWSHNLKSNVLTELQKWKYAFMERHRMEMKKEGEKHAVQMAGLKSELDTLKGLLRTYETSNQRKDEVIRNLSQVLERQKEKQEKMKTLTHWRLQHAHAVQVARQHYSLQLKRKVWQGWHGLVQKRWKTKVERACRSRAEEVCSHLSAEYEAKLAEQSEALDKSEAEIQRLHFERERYEESMKKAFMRGVCALNMEALNMFQSNETRTEQLPTQEPHASTSQEEMLPFTTVLHSSLPLGGIASTHKQVSAGNMIKCFYFLKAAVMFFQSGARIVTAGQQKSSKTVTARITARSDVGKVPHGGLQVMGVAPPMSSVVVERHHPITQCSLQLFELTVGQALASKFPRPLQQSHTSAVGRASSRTHTSTCSVHSIKEVE